MPFYFNGTLIPENVANAFSFNGTNVTKVVYNGTSVWEQQLFSATWSGNSSVSQGGFQTSGSLFRAYTTYTPRYGDWVTPINANGTMNTVSSGQVVPGAFESTFSIDFKSTNRIYITEATFFSNPSTSSAYVTFNSTTKFSGSAIGPYAGSGYATTGGISLTTSSGLIRIGHGSSYGAWVSIS